MLPFTSCYKISMCCQAAQVCMQSKVNAKYIHAQVEMQEKEQQLKQYESLEPLRMKQRTNI